MTTYMYTLNLFQNLAHCPEDESVILSSLYNTIAGLSVKQGMYSTKSHLYANKAMNLVTLFGQCMYAVLRPLHKFLLLIFCVCRIFLCYILSWTSCFIIEFNVIYVVLFQLRLMRCLISVGSGWIGSDYRLTPVCLERAWYWGTIRTWANISTWSSSTLNWWTTWTNS